MTSMSTINANSAYVLPPVWMTFLVAPDPLRCRGEYDSPRRDGNPREDRI